MNEVEKMYSNVGLSNMWVERYNDGYYEHERYYNSYKEMINNMMKANDWTLTEAQEVAKRECKKEHPPFTAKKQLELIKWLALRDTFDMMAWQNSEYHIEHDKYNANENSLEGCLARLINNLWQDLTEAEKAQIRNILE